MTFRSAGARILAGVVIIVGTLGFATEQASACSCVGNLMEFVDDPSIAGVMSGTVAEVPNIDGMVEPVVWKFSIDTVYRGDVGAPGDSVDIVTSSSGAFCGFEFLAVGDRRDILLRRDGDKWLSSLCEQAPVGALSSLTPQSALPETPQKPKPVDASESSPAGPLALGLLIGLGALAIVAIAGEVSGRRQPALVGKV